MHQITLELPDSLYQQAIQTAKQTGQSLNSLLQNSIAQALPRYDEFPPDLAGDLTALIWLNDVALWRIAGQTLSPTEQQQLTELLDKQQAESLLENEQQQLESLLESYQHLMVRRAEAAGLLQSRGYDISQPAVFETPLPLS